MRHFAKKVLLCCLICLLLPGCTGYKEFEDRLRNDPGSLLNEPRSTNTPHPSDILPSDAMPSDNTTISPQDTDITESPLPSYEMPAADDLQFKVTEEGYRYLIINTGDGHESLRGVCPALANAVFTPMGTQQTIWSIFYETGDEDDPGIKETIAITAITATVYSKASDAGITPDDIGDYLADTWFDKDGVLKNGRVFLLVDIIIENIDAKFWGKDIHIGSIKLYRKSQMDLGYTEYVEGCYFDKHKKGLSEYGVSEYLHCEEIPVGETFECKLGWAVDLAAVEADDFCLLLGVPERGCLIDLDVVWS